ncbi:MAG TPA: monofunctional biosynthetic peptidoglycan transglycosylase [Thauera aminoaromatica]|uniref:Biosynthetic peptidoglycan transglycosylase n=3 Tax=Thauera TaxID=33057 RepID=N6ZMY7_9RHOO|nr:MULTISPECIES: monofunctional biosynthetic peptidoglycan transglycosylase [Thauera]MDA0235492.1 monofunctional biosynthetic peptidoglycan transglycosylase [Pseudomonadota bacterium]ACR02274.1 monofunctional biosynthetic peptidoglycan transglycosylase [Thauera aminoaromatica]ENO83657.1 monofunctional biosynthetic peptidoglycan transglycosylase [Thauera aminoaromatica S2]ENO95698.1 monofunctional biosynthetic peptidoglycan transglycosylase [Thauera phenylacetica B4P]MBP6131982.1 monofunctional
MPIPAPRRILGWVARGLGVALLLALFWQAVLLTQVVWWSRFDPGSTSFMRIRLAELREADPRAELRQQWVPYERISIHLKRAVVAAEDDRFLDHDGFDWEGIERALERNAEEGRVTAGGSTISQQLAKNLFLSSSRSWLRKGQEAAITLMIEATWDKRRILEVYLNVAEWGNGVFGAEAAARHYYGRPAASLGPAEAARLAVMLPNPRRYEKTFGPRLAAHAARVQRRMANSQVP